MKEILLAFLTAKKHFFIAALILLSGGVIVAGATIQKEASNDASVLSSTEKAPTPTPEKEPKNPTVTPSAIPTKSLTENTPLPTRKIKRESLTNSQTSPANIPSTIQTNNSQQSQQTTTVNTSPTDTDSSPTPSPLPTRVIVQHPGSGGGGGATVELQNSGYQYVYATPTPNLGPFEASFSYDSSNGSARIRSNKPIKACEGVQKDPVISEGGGQLSLFLRGQSIRWGCPDGQCSYICELYFAPPNTPRYAWPYGAKVVSDQDEVKTFGDW